MQVPCQYSHTSHYMLFIVLLLNLCYSVTSCDIKTTHTKGFQMCQKQKREGAQFFSGVQEGGRIFGVCKEGYDFLVCGKGKPEKNDACLWQTDKWAHLKKTSPLRQSKDVLQVLYISAYEQIQRLLVPLYAHILTVCCQHKGSILRYLNGKREYLAFSLLHTANCTTFNSISCYTCTTFFLRKWFRGPYNDCNYPVLLIIFCLQAITKAFLHEQPCLGIRQRNFIFLTSGVSIEKRSGMNNLSPGETCHILKDDMTNYLEQQNYLQGFSKAVNSKEN